MAAEIKITVLEDGSIKMETGEISPAQHRQADQIFKAITEGMGGAFTDEKAKGRKSHQHVRRNLSA